MSDTQAVISDPGGMPMLRARGRRKHDGNP
jgi:hypothetical protein